MPVNKKFSFSIGYVFLAIFGGILEDFHRGHAKVESFRDKRNSGALPWSGGKVLKSGHFSIE